MASAAFLLVVASVRSDSVIHQSFTGTEAEVVLTVSKDEIQYFHGDVL